MTTTKQIPFVLVTIAMVSILAMGQANKLQDLVNARAGQAEGDLEKRGYVVTHNERSDDGIFAYWWHQGAKKCVCIKTVDGRYKSIVDAMAFDCNQKEDGGLSTGSKVVIASSVAAVIGALVLAHKAHSHDNAKHYDDPKMEAEYERGYRDGLYNGAYHNYNNSKEYSSGYGSGVGQRNNNLSHATGSGGYKPHVNVADLEGVRASSGESDLQSRGFRNVDGFKSGDTAYTIWWNGGTGQCLQVTTADGRYVSLLDIEEHPKCR